MDLATESQPNVLVPAPAPELFSLDFGNNGGRLSPTTLGELYEWIQVEIRFWSWVAIVPAGSHRNAIDAGIQCLHSAVQHIDSARRYEGSPSNVMQEQLGHVKNFLQDAYNNKGLPHSTSSLAQRVSTIQGRDVLEAIAYLYVFLPSSGHQFDARDVSSWRGFIEGISERFGLPGISHESYEASVTSAEKLRANIERLWVKKLKFSMAFIVTTKRCLQR